MTSHHHSSAAPVSRLDVPCLLYGSIGLGVAVAMQVVGLLKSADQKLLKTLLDPFFHGSIPEVLSLPALIVFTALVSYALAFVILDTIGTWRRVLIGVSVVVLVLAMIPSLAVWNMYFSPFLTVIAVFWTWFCSMMYVSHHVMPCDVAHAAHIPSSIFTVSAGYKIELPPATTDDASEGDAIQNSSAQEDARDESVNHSEKKQVNDSLKKYRPKDLDMMTQNIGSSQSTEKPPPSQGPQSTRPTTTRKGKQKEVTRG